MSRQPPDPHEVVAGLLADHRLLAACTARDMGSVFRLLNSRGVSTRRIAATVNITQGRLYDYMTGKSRVEKLTTFEQIADGLHIPGHLLGLARRGWEPTVVAPTISAIAAPDGDDVDAMEAFRSADRQAGGGRLYGAVVRHLSDHVAPRLVEATGGTQVFAAAAALTEMAGWMAHDSGRDDRAEQHFTRALPLARVSGDHPLAAHIAASNSHLSLQVGDPAQAAHWAQTGLELASLGPRIPYLVARLHAMQARALAAADQPAPAARALDDAYRALGQPSDIDHPWLSAFDPAALASEAALTWRDLHQLDKALKHAQEAVSLRECGRARSLALSRITLAGVLIRRKELEEAVTVGHELLATSPTLGSVRVLHQLDDLRSLLEPHSAHGPVREYLVRFADARRSRLLLLADIMTPSGGTG